MKKIEGHLQILQWIHILVVTFMALITAGFVLTMLEVCHHFTLTESLVIVSDRFRVKKKDKLKEVDI